MIIFIYAVRQGSSCLLLHVDIYLFKHHLLERLFFPHLKKNFIYLIFGCVGSQLRHSGSSLRPAGSSLLRAGFSLVVTHVLSSCGGRAQLPRGTWDLSSLTKGRTCILCIGRWILNNWTTREVPLSPLNDFGILVENQLTIDWFNSGLSILFHRSMSSLLPVSHCLDCCSFVVSLEIGKHESSYCALFFQDCFWLLGAPFNFI